MKERPILMKAPMVRAILECRKTQTRRICKERDGITVHPNGQVLARGGWLPELVCRYGVPGDRLWVKETWVQHDGDGPPVIYRADADKDGSVPYLMSGAGGYGGGVACVKVPRWKPSIFMPRWASRITLEIEAVRVERLIEITSEDAIAEGVSNRNGQYGVEFGDGVSLGWMQPEGAYRELWESINGPGSWDLDPWVWVIQFRRITP